MKEPPYLTPPFDEGVPGHAEGPLLTVFRGEGIVVQRRDAVDFGERDERGYYDYFYRFSVYAIASAGSSVTARRYADTWDTVSLFRSDGGWWKEIPYGEPAFVAAARYFASLDDVTTLDAFAGQEATYQNVDLGLIGARRGD